MQGLYNLCYFFEGTEIRIIIITSVFFSLSATQREWFVNVLKKEFVDNSWAFNLFFVTLQANCMRERTKERPLQPEHSE